MRNATRKMKIEIWLKSSGFCCDCGQRIRLDDFHADHVIPYSKGGPTEPSNLQPLCKRCNFRKGSRSMRFSETAVKVPALRAWQSDCIKLAESRQWFIGESLKPNFSINVSPGGGKTVFGIASWLQMKKTGACRKMVVVVPSRNLKRQWQRQCQRHGIRLSAENMYDLGDPSIDGCVITYAAVCASPNTLKAVCRDAGIEISGVFLICDEYHRVCQDRVTGGKMELAFSDVGKRLIMSGTFFRTDGKPMPWVDYDTTGYPITDYSYSMVKAITDGVLRMPEFLYLDGNAKFITIGSEESEVDEIKFSEAEDLSDESKIIESLIGDRKNLFTYLNRAVDQLRSCQEVNPDDRGGIVVSTVEQASKVQRALLELGVSSTVVTTPGEQDDGEDGELSLERDREAAKTDNERLMDEFRSGRGGDFIISVAMLREGTDLPNWRVMVYLSRCRSLLSFLQFIARCMRIRCQCENAAFHAKSCDFATGATNAHIFIPRTPTFIARAAELYADARAGLREKREANEQGGEQGGQGAGGPQAVRVLDESNSDHVYSAVRNTVELTTGDVSIVIKFADDADQMAPGRNLGRQMRGKFGHDEILLLLKAARGGMTIEQPEPEAADEEAFSVPPMSPEDERRDCNKKFSTVSNRIGHLLCEQSGITRNDPGYDDYHSQYRNQTIYKIHKSLGVAKWIGDKQPLSMLKRRLEVALEYERSILSKKGA